MIVVVVAVEINIASDKFSIVGNCTVVTIPVGRC